MKTIVSHLSPDIDSITATWLVKRFLPGWKEAGFAFVPAGSTYKGIGPDSDPEIIHVDTGFGQFDHHQSNRYECASSLVLDHLTVKGHLKEKQSAALAKMINEVTGLDHFREAFYPEPDNDRYEFLLHKIIEGGLKSVLREDEKIVEAVLPMLDSLFLIFLKKNQALEEIGKGFVFQSKWGKSLVMECRNEETVKLAMKMGYKLVARKDPEKGNARIKLLPGGEIGLKPLHEEILRIDRKGTWFLHGSGNMLLNSSSKNPNFVATSLTTRGLIDIIKGIK